MTARGEPGSPARAARNVVAAMGGRFSTEAGIDVDGGDREIERWFMAATLFGTRISKAIAVRTYRVLSDSGVATLDDAGARSWTELVALLDRGGYARYDERTARRLHDLSAAVRSRYPRGIADLGRRLRTSDEAVASLDPLPGWGMTTVHAFLRELRGVWPAAALPLDERVVEAARHAGLAGTSDPVTLADLRNLAADAGLDPRDLEAALLRLSLAHRGGIGSCPAGPACRIIDPASGTSRPPRGVRAVAHHVHHAYQPGRPSSSAPSSCPSPSSGERHRPSEGP